MGDDDATIDPQSDIDPQHEVDQRPDDGASLAERVARLEQLVGELTDLVHRSDAVSSTPDSGPDTPGTLAHESQTPGTLAHETATGDDPFWALRALKERLPAPGGVVYTGSVDVGQGHVEYQWGRPTEHLLQSDWAEHAESIAALGHPLRLAIMRRLLDAEHTVAQLVDELELASTGVAYHHLSALQSGGWVTSPRRGTWTVPVGRVVPLLAIITALEKG